MTEDNPAVSADAAGQIRLVLAAVFLAFLAQMTLNPIIAPLSREVGLAEWQVGVTISTAAVMVVLTSQFWGKRSQSWGRKPVLLVALTIACAMMALFAISAWFGMAGLITGSALFVLFVLFRGLGFGTALAAVPPTAQAFIADATHDEATRVKGMAGVGAAQGMTMIGGSIIGGALSLMGMLAPLLVIPLLLALGVLLLALRLKKQSKRSLIDSPTPVRPTDPRVWPFLLAGFGRFTALGFVQVITGFIVQDRFHLDASTAGAVTGLALLVAGIGMVTAQMVIVPKSGWSPGTLLRVGCPGALLGFIVLIPNAGTIALFVGILLIGLGLGVAMPGFTAGPTLVVERAEQGGLAGLVSATIGLTFIVAPTAGTSLYGVGPTLPIITGALIMAVVVVFVWAHPRLRRQRVESGSTVVH